VRGVLYFAIFVSSTAARLADSGAIVS
jgi:hypothetical protein